MSIDFLLCALIKFSKEVQEKNAVYLESLM